MTRDSKKSGCRDYLGNAGDRRPSSTVVIPANSDPGHNGPSGHGSPNGLRAVWSNPWWGPRAVAEQFQPGA
ncbi:MAG: hypothetical protein ACYCYK_09700 [Candidatus Dormibacteria bacterium]